MIEGWKRKPRRHAGGAVKEERISASSAEDVEGKTSETEPTAGAEKPNAPPRNAAAATESYLEEELLPPRSTSSTENEQ